MPVVVSRQSWLAQKTIQFFFNERANDFPLYTEAIKVRSFVKQHNAAPLARARRLSPLAHASAVQFFNHPESMVRIAVRTLTLNVYKVNCAEVRRFILDRSAVPYFSNLVWYLREEVRAAVLLLTSCERLDHTATASPGAQHQPSNKVDDGRHARQA